MHIIEKLRPNWRQLRIHESSPGRGYWVSGKLERHSPGYTPTFYVPSVPPGEAIPEMNACCENLEAQTFPDEVFDLVVTQDVMEHVFRPDLAFKEIARTLKPSGVHIFTVPLTRGTGPSRRLAELSSTGEEVYFQPPQYHGNPVDEKGALVTLDWGIDIVDYIYNVSSLFTTIYDVDRLNMGIRAELNQVLVSTKGCQPLRPGDVPI